MNYLEVQPTAYLSSTDNHDFLVTFFLSPIKTYFPNLKDLEEDLEDDLDQDPIEIGYIWAYRFDLLYSKDSLLYIADHKDSDLCKVAEFFFLNQKNYAEIEDSRYLFHIQKVFLKPEFRGKGYALKGLTMFLELLAKEEVVSCHPCHIEDMKEKYSKKKGKLLMRKYWSKLGLTEYSQKHNILWTNEWYMPEWIGSQLFR